MGLNLDMGLPGFGTQAGDVYDVIIIGGGPGGASAAIYTARADLRTLVIDKGLTAGALGITAKISNYPGVPGPVSGEQLVRTMREQAQSFGAQFMTDKVVGVDLGADPKMIMGGSGTYYGRTVILASGSMGRAATIPGEEEYLGRGVSYCATCDGAFFRGRPVAVVGSNDEALEEALFLTKFASQVHLLVPTPRLKASAALVEEITHSPVVRVYLGARAREVLGGDLVQGLRVHPREGAPFDLAVDGVFLYLQGSQPITDFLGGQVQATNSGCLVVDAEYQTTLPGVFAIGDLLCEHIKQAVIAAADGVQAAIAVDKFLHQRAAVRVDWS